MFRGTLLQKITVVSRTKHFFHPNNDGAKSKVGNIAGALAQIKGVAPTPTSGHCILHCHISRICSTKTKKQTKN